VIFVTGELVQNNTLELMGKGVAQTITGAVDQMVGSEQAKETIFFWVVVLLGISLAYYLWKKAGRG
jgi:hypothetical protein